MADNCRYWKAGKCNAPPPLGVSGCSFAAQDYDNCAMYKAIAAIAAGGSIEDALRAADCISPDADVAGGRGRILSDEELGAITCGKSEKKWWQFWK